ncbi:hypothetical protein NMP99_05875 [Glutamicibacter mishrai]|uniref:Uncharacterized protein n=1 Tax=Glutamicibacter mishrai TaxID=1775880 RepID=A0A6H0SLL5_9MICC|nr:hypothetical protein [Glutamicibacter mishrai]QIV88050.1 hypothetical protein D3791_13610 [Glutamicibacter mishrai]UTT40807.1 hypothetical protein NMP99_05875 [Glutamicibacter mishrai]
MGENSGGQASKPSKRASLPLSHSMKVFHWWMASLTALFLFAIPIIIGVIPPIDYKTDDLLFNVGVGSALVGIAAICLWVYQSLDDWLFRLGKGPTRGRKNR